MMKKNENFDAYAKYRYTKNTKKTGKKGKVFAILFVVFCLCVVVFFSISFSNFLVVGKIVNINSSFIQDKHTLFALSLASFDNASLANQKSLEQQKQGGAGFVFQTNGAYKVLSSIYPSQKDCQKVASNLGDAGLEAEIIELTLPAVNLKINLSSSSSQIFGEGLNLFFKNYQTLYSLSLDFDKQNIDAIKLKSEIKNLQENNLKVVNDFSNHFLRSSNVSVLYAKIYLNKINTNLENLISTDESVNLSSTIKQTYCKIINDYLTFCKEIA